MTPALWAVRALNLTAALGAAWTASRGLAVSLVVPAAVLAAVAAADAAAVFSGKADSPRVRRWAVLAACAAHSAAVVWLAVWLPRAGADAALLLPAVLVALEHGPVLGAVLGLAPAALLTWAPDRLAFFFLVPFAAGLALPEARARASAGTRETLARLRSAQVGEYLSFVTFQLRDYAITLSSLAQAIALSVPKEDAKLAERVERLRHTVGELNGKLARLLGDKSALTMTAPPTQTAVDIPALARDIRSEALAAFSPSGVKVELMVQGQVPPVRSDRRSIELALLSVLQNSLEACAARGAGAVTILIHREDAFVAVEVSDDGGGIAETLKPVVFEPFAASRAGSHGLGLGLSMSRRFIERIGGGLRLKSKGGCTAARLEIPIDKELPRIRNEESTWAGRRAGT